jgi:hypothetical protein
MEPKPKSRALFAILFGVPILLLVPVWLVGSNIYRAGSIEFAVLEKGPDGCHISGKVPAILVPAAVHFMPSVVIEEAGQEIRCDVGNAVEIVQAAARELSRCPDGVLVDVRTSCEIVTIEKRNGRIVIDVDTPDEAVRAAVPLSAVSSFLAAI